MTHKHKGNTAPGPMEYEFVQMPNRQMLRQRAANDLGESVIAEPEAENKADKSPSPAGRATSPAS